MIKFLSLYDLSSYLATFVNNMQNVWVILNTSIYDLLWGQLYDMLPDTMVLIKSGISLISLFFYNMRDVTVLSLLLGGFATFFVSFTVVKFLLNLVT